MNLVEETLEPGERCSYTPVMPNTVAVVVGTIKMIDDGDGILWDRADGAVVGSINYATGELHLKSVADVLAGDAHGDWGHHREVSYRT